MKGRKRHLATDTLGLILAIISLPANIQDRDGAVPAIKTAAEKYPSIQKIFADSA